MGLLRIALPSPMASCCRDYWILRSPLQGSDMFDISGPVSTLNEKSMTLKDRWSMNLWYIRMKIYDSSTILWYSTIHDSEWVHFHGLTTVFSLWCSRLWVWKFVKDNAFLSGFGKPSWLHIWQAHTRPFAILVAVSMVVNLMTQITSSVWTKHMLYMWAISALFQSREPYRLGQPWWTDGSFFAKNINSSLNDPTIPSPNQLQDAKASHVTRNERPRLAENDDRLTTTGEILWGTSGNLSTLSDLVSDGQVDQMLWLVMVGAAE